VACWRGCLSMAAAVGHQRRRAYRFLEPGTRLQVGGAGHRVQRQSDPFDRLVQDWVGQADVSHGAALATPIRAKRHSRAGRGGVLVVGERGTLAEARLAEAALEHCACCAGSSRARRASSPGLRCTREVAPALFLTENTIQMPMHATRASRPPAAIVLRAPCWGAGGHERVVVRGRRRSFPED
jgi:hypothetical protein